MDVVLSLKDEKENVNFSIIEILTSSIYYEKQLFFGGILPLGIASIIYILFRSETLIIFEIFEKLNVFNTIGQIRSYPTISSSEWPEWFLYALPDGLYTFSFTSFILLIWGNKIFDKSRIWIYSIPIMAIASELLQYFGWFPGTYDIADLMFYILGFILPFCLFSKKLNYNTNVSENSMISMCIIVIYLFLALIAGDETLFHFL